MKDFDAGRRLEEVEDWEHNIHFKELNIRTIYREKLFTKEKADVAIIYCFVKYPYLSNGFSNSSTHFVGIKMYDAEYKEVPITSLSSEKRPSITFDSAVEGRFNLCKLFDSKKKLTTTGVETKELQQNQRKFYSCRLSSLGEVAMSDGEEQKNASSFPWLIVCLSVGGVIILAVIIFIVFRICKKKKTSIPSLEVDAPLMGVNNIE